MIRAATPDDIPALMGIERRDGYDVFVGRWSAEQHAAEMALPGSCYLVSRAADGVIDGFTILQGLDDPNGCATLRRIAVDRPGEGLGPMLLDATLALAFGERGAHRLQLRVYPENTRARRAYERAGFVAEGLMRDVSRQAGGSFRSMVLMAVLRPDWLMRTA